MGNASSSDGSNEETKQIMNKSNSAFYRSRRAQHAGSWYTNHKKDLSATLDQFLEKASLENSLVSSPSRSLRAVVCPHAGYSYSGPTAAYSYKALKIELSSPSSQIRTIVVLHPSHHVYLNGCAVSGASVIETPLGNLAVDQELRQDILSNLQSPPFTIMKQSEDENEHSGEMQYPFVAHILNQTRKQNNVRILPIMCGALSIEQETRYGQALAGFLEPPHILTIVSTDFCHWGSRFQYNPTPTTTTMPIHSYIEHLDRRGMDLIAAQEPGAFAEYLRETQNTICGRHAVAVWLRAMKTSHSSEDYHITFLSYAQSSAVISKRDSSVSYAAACCTSTAHNSD